MTFIADTGFVLARWSKSQARRRWASQYFEQYEPPFITADTVLIEAGYRLDRQELEDALATFPRTISSTLDAGIQNAAAGLIK